MKFPNEMQKLRQMLTEMGIRWADASSIMSQAQIERSMNIFNLPEKEADISIYRTHFTAIGCHYSVICGYGTYGGEDGLLEMMSDDEEPTGWLTAEDIIGKIQEELR